MANLNKVMLIGRLTRDPEPILGGKGAKFGFAVNNRKQNQDTQQWEDVPVFIDMEIWNRGEMGKQAERLLQTVRKGHQVFIEGHLKLDTWTEAPEKGGAKRSKLSVVVETFQYLEPRADGGNGGNGGAGTASQPRQTSAGGGNRGSFSGGPSEYDEPPAPAYSQGGGGGKPPEDDIPF
jgi:single-strand DNA-binding protein